MNQVLRAMNAGRCRRFAYPAALVGFIDALGRVLRGAEGFYPQNEVVRALYEPLVAFATGDHTGPLVRSAANALGLLPYGIGGQWWLPAVLGAVLLVLGRTAANQRRRARTQLAAFRLAVAGSVLMAVVLLSTGFVMVGAGLLMPLDTLFGGR